MALLAAELTETRLRLTDAQHQIEEKHEEALAQAENAEQLKVEMRSRRASWRSGRTSTRL